MKAWMARLGVGDEAGLLRPLWNEPRAERRRRSLRFLVLAPFGIVMGIAFGVYGAGPLGVRAPFLSLVGSVGALVVLHLVTRIESWIRIHGKAEGGWKGLVLRVAADLVGGGILGHFLGQALGAHALAALSGGAALMAGYSYAATRLFLDDVLGDLLRLLTGQVSGEREPDYSYEESLAARGRVDEALAAYEEASRRRPGDPGPLLRAARLLREEGRPEEAVARYRQALDLPDLAANQAVGAVLQIREICLVELDDPAAARPAMRTLVERFPDVPPAGWMREELEEAESPPSPEGRRQ